MFNFAFNYSALDIRGRVKANYKCCLVRQSVHHFLLRLMHPGRAFFRQIHNYRRSACVAFLSLQAQNTPRLGAES